MHDFDYDLLVIGFPSLALTSMEQGMLAACQAFQVPAQSVPELFPYGIYSVPDAGGMLQNRSFRRHQSPGLTNGKAARA
jgi:hypothetical protein